MVLAQAGEGATAFEADTLREVRAWALTANRLIDGEVVFWKAGQWVERFADAELFDEPTAAEAAEAHGKNADGGRRALSDRTSPRSKASGRRSATASVSGCQPDETSITAR